MTKPIHPPPHDSDRPLLDLDGLAAGVRWHRRIWLTLSVIGLLLGLAAATVLPSRSSATTDVFVIHANEELRDGASLMKTDLALLQTTTVASVAVGSLRIGMTPENFVRTYSAVVVADNILEITATGANDAEALARAQAIAEAFITVHVKQSDDATQASVKAYTDRRNQLQQDLDQVERQIAAGGQGADPQALSSRRGSLASQVGSIDQQVEQVAIGSPQVAAGTKILNTPHLTSRGFLTALVLYGGIGFGAGLVLGLLFAAIAAIVRDRPVLRRDIVAHLGASVVAQIPAPLRGPKRLIRRSSAAKDRARTAGTLARLIRESPEPVSVLELGCPRAAAALVKDIAEELATELPVVIVDDLPGDEMSKVLGAEGEIELVPGSDFPPASPPTVDTKTHRLAIATVSPKATWTDLRRLGAEALLVVQAGRAEASWMHTVARQLADAGIAVIGLVVVHPDPRDKSDGTVWDALHTAVRGRLAAAGKAPEAEARSLASAARLDGAVIGGFRFDPGPSVEVMPAGARTIQIDSPTMVIPVVAVANGHPRPVVRPGPRPSQLGPVWRGSAAAPVNGASVNGSKNGSASHAAAAHPGQQAPPPVASAGESKRPDVPSSPKVASPGPADSTSPEQRETPASAVEETVVISTAAAKPLAETAADTVAVEAPTPKEVAVDADVRDATAETPADTADVEATTTCDAVTNAEAATSGAVTEAEAADAATGAAADEGKPAAETTGAGAEVAEAEVAEGVLTEVPTGETVDQAASAARAEEAADEPRPAAETVPDGADLPVRSTMHPLGDRRPRPRPRPRPRLSYADHPTEKVRPAASGAADGQKEAT